MEKKDIKLKIRESLAAIVEGDEKKRNIKRDYADVQNAFTRPLAPSQVDVMKHALGWNDDESGVNRSYFGKMLHQEKNDDGGLYQFDDKQLASIRAALKEK